MPNVDSATTPTMVTANSDLFISDSGYLKYHIITDLYNTFDNTSDPRMTFPDGLSFEQYDHGMNVVARGRCDSAVYWTARKLWRFDGHVVAVNSVTDTFMTPNLYWDQARNKMYTDSFMHITKADYIIEGYGFEGVIVANELSNYRLLNPTAIIPLQDGRPAPGMPGTQTASAPGDTMVIPASQRQAPTRASRREAAPTANAATAPQSPGSTASPAAVPAISRGSVTQRR
jgi:lipopolysaccharide export system protein LptC